MIHHVIEELKKKLGKITLVISIFISAVVILLYSLSAIQSTSLSALAATNPSPDIQAALAAAQLHSWFNTNAYTTTGWWQSANALSATIDFMQGTGSRAYLSDVQNFYNAHASTNFIVNKYYDDEGWWALTWIKAYKLTGNTAYLNTAKAIFTNMTGGWDTTCGGGVWWTTDKTYKNAIPNELFLTIATQLHELTPGDTAYLNWANQEWAWFQNSGMITSSNLIVDGLSSTCQPLTSSKTWTYNQGVILNGLVNLYTITQDASLLTTAQNIANATISSSTLSPNGILTEPCEAGGTCSGDNAIFKGIFMQNLTVLYNQTGNAQYQAYMQQNASSVWANDKSGGNKFGLHWAGPFDSADAAREASTLDLFNTLAKPASIVTSTSSTPINSGMYGLCLDDRGNGIANNNPVDIYSCNGSAAQKWTITTSGTIQINGKCMDITGNGTANGTKVELYTCNGGKNQQWQVMDDGYIYNPQSGKCLDDPGWSTTNNTQLDIWACNGGSNQVWYIQ